MSARVRFQNVVMLLEKDINLWYPCSHDDPFFVRRKENQRNCENMNEDRDKT